MGLLISWSLFASLMMCLAICAIGETIRGIRELVACYREGCEAEQDYLDEMSVRSQVADIVSQEPVYLAMVEEMAVERMRLDRAQAERDQWDRC